MMCNLLIKKGIPAPVTDESVKKIISDKPVTYGPMNQRFSLYIKQRQEGTWIKYICKGTDVEKYSLDDEVLKKFPPTILAAATLDPDVPYKVSKTLSRIIPNSKLITIYEDVHDFDRDTGNQSGRLAYDEIINWLENNVNNQSPTISRWNVNVKDTKASNK